MTVLSWVQDFRSTGKYDVSIPFSAFIFHLSFQGRQSASCAMGEVVMMEIVLRVSLIKVFLLSASILPVSESICFLSSSQTSLLVRYSCVSSVVVGTYTRQMNSFAQQWKFYSLFIAPIESFMALNFET